MTAAQLAGWPRPAPTRKHPRRAADATRTLAASEGPHHDDRRTEERTEQPAHRAQACLAEASAARDWDAVRAGVEVSEGTGLQDLLDQEPD